jgi:hypothetical protein
MGSNNKVPSQTIPEPEVGARPIADPQPAGGALTAVIPRAKRCIPASWAQGRALSYQISSVGATKLGSSRVPALRLIFPGRAVGSS